MGGGRWYNAANGSKIRDIAKFESKSPALPNIARVIETGGNIIGIARELHETMR